MVFDLGETLSDETRSWGAWADWMGIPRFTFFALVGAQIAEGQSHRDVFPLVRPGADMEEERRRRAAAGASDGYEVIDLYPDVTPCLQQLAVRGLAHRRRRQSAGLCQKPLRAALPDLDLIGLSEAWGIEKPAPAFFERVSAELGLHPSRVVFVGDRLDNDVLPAQRSGMTGVHLRRGPWGFRDAVSPVAAAADVSIDGLDELPGALRARRSSLD